MIPHAAFLGSGPEGDEVLWNTGGLSFVIPFVCSSVRPPQALSGLKSTLLGLKSALSCFESGRAD